MVKALIGRIGRVKDPIFRRRAARRSRSSQMSSRAEKSDAQLHRATGPSRVRLLAAGTTQPRFQQHYILATSTRVVSTAVPGIEKGLLAAALFTSFYDRSSYWTFLDLRSERSSLATC